MIKPGSSLNLFQNSVVGKVGAEAEDTGSFFTGHMNLQRLEFDPIITGYALIIWTKIPNWMERKFPNFKAMTQKNFKAFDGISDMDLNAEDYTHTFNSNAYGVASSIQKNNTEFTLKHQEFSGSPIKNMYQFWVSSIRDPRTDIATYPVEFGMEYAAKNHTGELMYIVTRPDANNVEYNNIEFAAYYTNVFPTKIPLSHLNYSQGDHSLVEIDIPFRGTMNISQKVDAYAKELLKTTYSFVAEGMFDPKNEGKYGDKNTLGTFNTSDSYGVFGDTNGISSEITRNG